MELPALPAQAVGGRQGVAPHAVHPDAPRLGAVPLERGAGPLDQREAPLVTATALQRREETSSVQPSTPLKTTVGPTGARTRHRGTPARVPFRLNALIFLRGASIA